MSDTAPTARNCRWTDQTKSCLVDFVSTNWSEAADSMTFKKAFWEQVAVYVAQIEALGTKHKSGKSCRLKQGYLKADFLIVKCLKELLGIQWDEQKGFNIGATSNRSDGSALEVLDEYIKKHPKASKFKRKGFPLYKAIFDLMPSRARGANVFQPVQTVPATLPTTSFDTLSSDALDLDPSVADGPSPSDSDSSSNNEDEEDLIPTQEWPASPPASRKRKVSAIDLTTPPPAAPCAKKGQVTPILKLSNRLGDLTNTYCSRSAPSTTLTPTCQCTIKELKNDPKLEIAKKVSLLNSFMKSTTAVSIYSALPEGSKIHTAWAKDQYAQEVATRA